MIVNPYVYNSRELGRKEIDLRVGLNQLLFGSAEEEAHGQIFIIRHFRIDENDRKIKCPVCSHPSTGEGTSKYKCQYCNGEGYLWDEHTAIGYRTEESPAFRFFGKETEFGEVPMVSPFITFPHYVTIDKRDMLIDPTLDEEGNIVSPISISRKYKVPWLREFRLDGGRIEYIKVRITEIPK